MIVLGLLALGCVIALAVPLIRLCVLTLRVLRHRKVLRGTPEDWWPEFERQFRAYTEDSSKHHRSRRV